MDAYRQNDALGIYLSGALSHDGAQTDPGASLGGYKSSTEISSIGGIVTNPIPPLVYEKFSGENGEGTATVRGTKNDYVYYTAPGDTEGEGVLIVNGERKLVFSNDITKWIRVYRASANNIIGSSTLTLLNGYNGLFGMSNVANADRVAGLTTYRAAMLEAHGAYGVLGISIWLDNSNCQSTYAIGMEAPSGHAIQTIANETTAPMAVSFSTPTTKGTGLSILSMNVGDVYGLWIRRVFPAAGIVSVAEYPLLYVSHWGA